jgi:hypothetical protein
MRHELVATLQSMIDDRTKILMLECEAAHLAHPRRHPEFAVSSVKVVPKGIESCDPIGPEFEWIGLGHVAKTWDGDEAQPIGITVEQFRHGFDRGHRNHFANAEVIRGLEEQWRILAGANMRVRIDDRQ